MEWGGSDPSSVSTSAPASSTCCLLSPFNLAAIARPNLRIRDWSVAGSWHAETLSLTNLRVASKIHAFSLRPVTGDSGRPSAGPQRLRSPLLGRSVVGGGGRLRPPRYYSRTCQACGTRGAKHPATVGDPIASDAGNDSNNADAICCCTTAYPQRLWRPWISQCTQKTMD